MESTIDNFVSQIHNTSARLVLALSGGGSDTLSRLLAVPGASRTILEAVVPYSQQAMRRWLGGTPDQFCSPRTARAMAMSAFHRACEYESPEGYPLAGLGVTASLATDRPKRGEHRIHLALQTVSRTVLESVTLGKDQRTRREEETVTSTLILNLAAEACGLDERLPLELAEGEHVERHEKEAPELWRDLLLGKTNAVCHGGAADGQSAPRALFSGAFNPLHVGHQRMMAVAASALGTDVDFEISILNVDKPPLDYLEIGRRIDQFGADQRVWLSRTPTFVQKSKQFRGTTFVAGIDTLRRIAAPRYYGGSQAECDKAIDTIAGRGCRFLVFGRSIGGSFIRLGDLGLPPALASICREVPESQFREDVSSTEIRRQKRIESALDK